VATLDRLVEIFENPNDSRAFRLIGVGTGGEEIQLAWDRDPAHQIRHKQNAPGQYSDQERFPACVVLTDFLSQLPDSVAQRLLRDEDFVDVVNERQLQSPWGKFGSL